MCIPVISKTSNGGIEISLKKNKDTIDVLVMRKYMRLTEFMTAGTLIFAFFEENLALYSFFFFTIGLAVAFPASMYLVLRNRG